MSTRATSSVGLDPRQVDPQSFTGEDHRHLVSRGALHPSDGSLSRRVRVVLEGQDTQQPRHGRRDHPARLQGSGRIPVLEVEGEDANARQVHISPQMLSLSFERLPAFPRLPIQVRVEVAAAVGQPEPCLQGILLAGEGDLPRSGLGHFDLAGQPRVVVEEERVRVVDELVHVGYQIVGGHLAAGDQPARLAIGIEREMNPLTDRVHDGAGAVRVGFP